MATAAQVNEFKTALQDLAELAQRDLADVWSALIQSGDPNRVRDELLDFFPDLVQAYGDTAAVLGADWYHLLRDLPPSARAFEALLADSVPAVAAQESARWALAPLFEDNPDSALSLLDGVTQRLVLQPARDTIWQSAALDPVRTGVARIPSGTTTCRFCLMVASRGPVYSQISAEMVVGQGSLRTGYDRNGKRLRGGIGGGIKPRGNRQLGQKYHDNCDCVAVVVRSPLDYPEGYDLAELKERYYASRDQADHARHPVGDN